MMDERLRTELQSPAVGLKPSAEIQVAARSDALGEAADPLECVAADQQIPRGRPSPAWADQPLRVIEQVARAGVPGRQGPLIRGTQYLAGQRAAVVMSLVQSAKLNEHDPWAYLSDVLKRLPTQLNSRIEELLPHRWQASGR